MRCLLLALALLLAGCATKVATAPSVPKDILACKKKVLADVPVRDLTDKEVEDAWSDNRATAIEKDDCLGRLIAGNQAAAKQRGAP